MKHRAAPARLGRPLLLAFGLFAFGCASSTHTPHPAPPPWPTVPEPGFEGEQPGSDPLSAKMRAADWLEEAFALLHGEQYPQGIAALHAAIDTQDLNDAGRALAYWHIYGAEQSLGHMQAAQNALADFVVVASDMMAQIYADPQADEAGRAFIERFDLPGRLARSRATLSLAWAARAQSYGRSAQTPVTVQSETEMRYFIDLVPPCAQASDRRISQRLLHPHALGHPIAQVTLHCQDTQQPIDYYFEVIAPKAATLLRDQALASDQEAEAQP